MNMHSGRRHREPQAILDRRVLALEDRVTALAEALRVLAHGLEELPTAEPGEGRAAEAARQAYDLLLAAEHPASQADKRPGS